MRTALLWMARNERMQQTIPTLPFAQRAVRRFMPGERVEDAFAAAERLRDERIGVLFTRLGENISALEEAQEVTAHYRSVLERDAARAHTVGPIEISIKPTQLGLDQDVEACLARCHDIAERCAANGTWFWVDMEGSEYTDATMDLAEALMSSHDNVGIALQAYLRRSAADVQRLLPLKPAIRLVKGAYDEPAAIAYRSATAVDANFLALAVIVASAAARGEARLALGTHDVELIEQIRTITDAQGIPVSKLEVHMLYGIRERELGRLRDAGHPAFSLVAYGSAWYRWYMRRLAERPANIIFALRQLLP
jgi:proline dehydrogenase